VSVVAQRRRCRPAVERLESRLLLTTDPTAPSAVVVSVQTVPALVADPSQPSAPIGTVQVVSPTSGPVVVGTVVAISVSKPVSVASATGPSAAPPQQAPANAPTGQASTAVLATSTAPPTSPPVQAATVLAISTIPPTTPPTQAGTAVLAISLTKPPGAGGPTDPSLSPAVDPLVVGPVAASPLPHPRPSWQAPGASSDPGETDESADDLTGAQALPDVPTVEVYGAFTAKKNEAYYRLPADLSTTSYDLEVHSQASGAPVSDEVTVYDEGGHRLMQSEPAPGTFSLRMVIPPWMIADAAGHPRTLYVRISLPQNPVTPPAPASTGLTYAASSGTSDPAVQVTPTSPDSSGFVLMVHRLSSTPQGHVTMSSPFDEVPLPTAATTTSRGGVTPTGAPGAARDDGPPPLATGLSPVPV
jgi:hypothetical protein